MSQTDDDGLDLQTERQKLARRQFKHASYKARNIKYGQEHPTYLRQRTYFVPPYQPTLMVSEDINNLTNKSVASCATPLCHEYLMETLVLLNEQLVGGAKVAKVAIFSLKKKKLLLSDSCSINSEEMTAEATRKSD